MDRATDDPRIQRLRRGTLVDLSLIATAAMLVSRSFPRLEPWLGPSRGAALVLTVLAFAAGSVAWWRGRQEKPWNVADELGWASLLAATATTAGATSGSLGMASVLHVMALVALAMRDPSDTMTVVAGASAALAPLVRAAVAPPGAPISAIAVSSAIGVLAFVAVTVQTRRASRAVAERDALIAEITRAARAQQSASSVAVRRAPPVPPPRPAQRERVDTPADIGWDALSERVRTSVTTLAEASGVSMIVRVDTRGLAPPSQKIRANLVKIAQEAATQTIRHAEPRAIEMVVRRGDGGVLLELIDDAPASDGSRQKRAVANLRNKLTALGGTASLERDDRGWVTRVKLPADQLN